MSIHRRRSRPRATEWNVPASTRSRTPLAPSLSAELASRLSREREREGVGSLRRSREHSMGDSPGENSGLARPRSGDHGDKTRLGDDRASLIIIEIDEQVGRFHGATVPAAPKPLEGAPVAHSG